MKWQPQKMIWWYWALIDEMIANPECTKKEFAARFKVSEVCIHLVTTSDVFQAYLAERRAGNSKMLDESIRLKLQQTADRVLGVIQTVIEKKKDAIPLDQLTTLADKTLERLGYGVKGSGLVVNTSGPTQVVVPVSIQDLEAARRALRMTEAAKLLPASNNGFEGTSVSPAGPLHGGDQNDNTYPYNEFQRVEPEAIGEGSILSSELSG